MTGIYIAGSEVGSGKSAIAVGVQELMGRRFARLGVFRPVVGADGSDALLALLRSRGAADTPEQASIGVSYDEVHADQDAAIAEIVVRYSTRWTRYARPTATSRRCSPTASSPS